MTNSSNTFTNSSSQNKMKTTRLILICSATLFVILTAKATSVQAMWFFQDQSVQNTSLADLQAAQQLVEQISKIQEQPNQQDASPPITDQKSPTASSYGSYSTYGSNLLSIAGIQPSSIAALLNTVGDTGFRYFNIQDQCRNRAACDLGFMLYKKLSFIHNWLIRTSVRTLTDMNNVYTQSWMEGMLGRNCTSVYLSCRQSPLEGIMNLAVLQHLATR